MDVKETPYRLKQQLLTSAIRHRPEQRSSFLVDAFHTFASSGKTFSKAEIIAALQSQASVPPVR